MNPPIARDHHYVPRFLLKEFTDHEGRLWVFNTSTGRQRRLAPGGVAYERDFHRVEAHGYRPDYLEGIISCVEDRAAPVVATLIRTGFFPDDVNQRQILLAFLALQTMRVPSVRDFHRDISERGRRGMLKLAWDSRYLMLNTLRLLFPGLDKTHIDALTSEHFRFPENDRTPEMLTMAIAANKVAFPLLQRLDWSVLTSPAGRFVLSDRPVVMLPSPTRCEQVFVALGKNRAVYGTGHNQTAVSASQTFRQIARWNGYVVSQSKRIYAPIADFPWMDSKGDTRLGVPVFCSGVGSTRSERTVI
jgi:hypothetical protein